MKYWKKLSALGLALALTLSLAACGSKEETAPETEEEQKQEEVVETPDASDVVARVGGLKGPTGMGMAYLEELGGDANELTILGTPTEAPPMMLKGELDIACLPANMASVLYNKMEGNLVNLAINTLGVIYMVENGETINSMADLKGKTIVSSGKDATPEYVLRYLLTQNGLDPDKDVTIEWKAEHSECISALAAGTATIAMMPQPFVTVAQSKIEGLRVALDFTEEWNKLDNGSQLLTGVVVARKDFVESHPEAVENFLTAYAASVEKVNADTVAAAARIGEMGIVDAKIAEKALPYCNIVYMDGAEMKEALSGYLQILMDANPQSVGGKLPADDFYYGA